MFTSEFNSNNLSNKPRTDSSIAEYRVRQFFNPSRSKFSDHSVYNIMLRKKIKEDMFTSKRLKLISQSQSFFSQLKKDEEKESEILEISATIQDLSNEIKNLNITNFTDFQEDLLQKIRYSKYSIEDMVFANDLLKSNHECLQYLGVIYFKKVTDKINETLIDELFGCSAFNSLLKILKTSKSEDICTEIIEIYINFDIIISNIIDLFINDKTVSAIISRLKDFSESFIEVSFYFLAILLNPRECLIKDFTALCIKEGMFTICCNELRSWYKTENSIRKLNIILWLIQCMLFEVNSIESKERIECCDILTSAIEFEYNSNENEDLESYFHCLSILSEYPEEIIDSVCSKTIVKILVKCISNPSCRECIPCFKIMCNITVSEEHKKKILDFFDDLFSFIDIIFCSMKNLNEDKIFKAINLIDCFTYQADTEFIDNFVSKGYLNTLIKYSKSCNEENFEYPKKRAFGKVICNIINFCSKDCLSSIYSKNLLNILIRQLDLQNGPQIILRALVALERIFDLHTSKTEAAMNAFDEINGHESLEKMQESNSFEVGLKARNMIEKYYECEELSIQPFPGV